MEYSSASVLKPFLQSLNTINHIGIINVLRGASTSTLLDMITSYVNFVHLRFIYPVNHRLMIKFLKKQHLLQLLGLVIAEVEFCCPEHVVVAEKLREQIVGSLQDVLRCNADVRINLVPTSESKTTKSKKQSFRLPDSSGRKQERSDAGIKVDALKISNKEEEVAGVCSRYHKECPSTVMHQFDVNSVPFFHDKESAAVENVELNTPCTGTVCNKSVQDNVPEGQNQRRHPVSQSREEDEEVSLQEPGNQPSCFQNLLMHQRRFFSYTAACAKCPKIQPRCKVKFSFPRKPSIGACHCIKKPCHICSKSQAQVAYSHDGVNRYVDEILR